MAAADSKEEVAESNASAHEPELEFEAAVAGAYGEAFAWNQFRLVLPSSSKDAELKDLYHWRSRGLSHFPPQDTILRLKRSFG